MINKDESKKLKVIYIKRNIKIKIFPNYIDPDTQGS